MTISKSRRLGVLLVTIAFGVSATPAAAPAATSYALVLGGKTSQGWPVVVTFNQRISKSTRISIGIHLDCSDGTVINQVDSYTNSPVSRAGKYFGKFGPETHPNADGTSVETSGSYTGKINRLVTKASGTWQYKLVEKDATGAVKATCDSGLVTWSAKN